MDLDFLLIRKMKQGDDAAFDLFIRKYYKDILSYCSYHCIDKGYAEDLTQETFIRFFTKLSSYHYKGKTKNYLYTIANHLCIDYMKKVKEIPTEEEELAEKAGAGEQKKDKVLDRISIESAMEKQNTPEYGNGILILLFAETDLCCAHASLWSGGYAAVYCFFCDDNVNIKFQYHRVAD